MLPSARSRVRTIGERWLGLGLGLRLGLGLAFAYLSSGFIGGDDEDSESGAIPSLR